jgi:hypothetical protein
VMPQILVPGGHDVLVGGLYLDPPAHAVVLSVDERPPARKGKVHVWYDGLLAVMCPAW